MAPPLRSTSASKEMSAKCKGCADSVQKRSVALQAHLDQIQDPAGIIRPKFVQQAKMSRSKPRHMSTLSLNGHTFQTIYEVFLNTGVQHSYYLCAKMTRLATITGFLPCC